MEALLREVGRGLVQQDTGEVRSKGTLDVVSELDVWAEERITKALRDLYPNDTILSEEAAHDVEYAERLWVLDPLDGTVNRTTGIPFFAISLALLENGMPVEGYVYDPVHDELFSARRGQGATCNGLSLRVTTEGVQGIGLTSGVFQGLVDHSPDKLREFLGTKAKVRNLGAQALHLAYVASGRLMASASLETKLWDNAAGVLLVVEAGGVVSHLDGSEAYPVRPRDPRLRASLDPCLACPPEVHAELVSLLSHLPGARPTGPEAH